MKRRGRKPYPDILTPRELEVLALIDAGHSNEAIAEHLGITIDGVKFHVSEILSRLAVPTRHDAAHWYREHRAQGPLLLAPLALLRRLRLPSWLVPLSGTIVVAVLAGVALLAWGVFTGRDQTTPAPPTAAVALAFLSTPNTTSGAGWTIETRVANLNQLDLAIAIESVRAGIRATLFDVPSGRAVAVATFDDAKPYIRLRAHPAQLVISTAASNDIGYQLETFDILPGEITPAGAVGLPDRISYQDYYDVMYLSPDGRRAYVAQQRRANRPECANANASDYPCFTPAIGVVDLDALTVTFADLPSGCEPYTITPSASGGAAVYCFQIGASSGSGLLALTVDNDGSASAPVDVPAYEQNTSLPYAALTRAAVLTILRGDGVVWRAGEPGDSTSLLPAGHEVIDTRQIDADRVLVLAGRALPTVDVHITEAVVVDVARARVVSSVDVPAGYIEATVLDAARGLLLSKTGDRIETRTLDFATGKLGDPVTLTGLPGVPDHLVR